MARKRELVVLIIIVVVLITGYTNSLSHNDHQKTSTHSTCFRIIYPQVFHTLNTTVKEIEKIANSVNYLQSGNLTVNYNPNRSIRGEYDFIIRNTTHNLNLYLAVVDFSDVLKLNISLEGNNVSLDELDRYIIKNNTLGLRAKVYVINISTSLPEIKGKIRYRVNYSFMKTLNPSWTIGTPLTWWAVSGKGDLVNLTVSFPSDYVFFLPSYGLSNSTIRIENFNISRINEAFFMKVSKVQEISAGGMNVTIYVPPNCRCSPQSLKDFKKKVRAALTLYVNVTGVTPTKRTYILLNPSWSMGDGMTTDTKIPVVIIGCYSRYAPPSVGNVVYSNPGLIFHELGHLWFGDYADLGRIDESLATYMNLLAMSKTDKQYLNYLDDIENLKILPNIKSMPSIDAYKEGIPNPTIRSAIIYYKGAFVFRSLQFVLGNETFFEGLRELLRECHGKECNLTDVQKVFERVSGQNLDWFFREWFYTTKVPDYYVENLGLTRESGKYILNFEIIDKNNFTMPLEVEVITANEKVIKKVWIDGRAKVSFELEDKPATILLDPNEWMVNENREYTLGGIEIIVN
ncbi:M1 family aminopeptidase [Thermococcus sp.]